MAIIRITRNLSVYIVLAAASVLVLSNSGDAVSSPSIKKSIWGPLERNGKPQFPIYHDLGVGIYHTRLNWADTAPTAPRKPTDPEDPAYHWPPELDRIIKEAAKYKIKVSLQLSRTPTWANGGKSSNWVPRNPDSFGQFAEAAARRYPDVKLWMIWGEPQRQPSFMPLVPERRGRTTLTRAQALAPRNYSLLLESAYKALKRVSPRNLVIGGSTYTVGEISPYNWIRYMRLPNGRRPRLDLFAHNPFITHQPRLKRFPRRPGPEVNYSDFSDLRTFTKVLDANLRDPKGRPLRVFISEFFFPTDHKNQEFPYYVSRKVQAAWLGDALRIVKRWDRIYTLGWLGLYDDPPQTNHLEVNRGLIDFLGHKKPSYAVFKRG